MWLPVGLGSQFYYDLGEGELRNAAGLREASALFRAPDPKQSFSAPKKRCPLPDQRKSAMIHRLLGLQSVRSTGMLWGAMRFGARPMCSRIAISCAIDGSGAPMSDSVCSSVRLGVLRCYYSKVPKF